MANATLRAPAANDISQLAALRARYAREQKDLDDADDPGFVDRFTDWYHHTIPVSRWLVAEVNGSLVGMVHMFVHARMPMPTYDAGGWGYLSLLYVDPDQRGNGLGRQLVESIELEAIELGFTKMLLNPTSKANPLYQRCGYLLADTHLVHALNPAR